MNRDRRSHRAKQSRDASPHLLIKADETSTATQTVWTREDLFRIALDQISAERTSGATDRLRTSIKALSRLRIPGNKEAVLQIPSSIAADIAKGTLSRTGGVIRNAQGAIVGHLKDAQKLKQALKGPVLPLMLLDFAEGALLNRKLDEIQHELSLLSRKVDQLQHAQIALPFEKVARLAHLDSSADREVEMRQIFQAIDAALALLRRRLADEWHAVDAAVADYRNRSHRFPGSHGKARNKIFNHATALCSDAHVAVALSVLRTRLHQELRQARAAAASSREAVELATDTLDRLNRTLGKDSETRRVDHIKTLFARKAKITSSVIDRSNPLLRNLGNLVSTALLQFVLRDTSDGTAPPQTGRLQ